MIRMFLIILLFLICCDNCISYEGLDSSREVSHCRQSGFSSEYYLCNLPEFFGAGNCSLSNESGFSPDVKIKFISDYKIVDEIKGNGTDYVKVTTFFLVSKGNVSLSILRT